MPAYPPGYLDEYCGGPLLGASITFIILNIAFVGLRFAARRESKALPGWDDYFVLPALAVNLALDVADIGKTANLDDGWLLIGFPYSACSSRWSRQACGVLADQ